MAKRGRVKTENAIKRVCEEGQEGGVTPSSLM